ncbi:hypothetical protein [Nostoc cycadae]|uniref:YtkA family protein n=1 Tax=Nostoc cycadae WK-1 TaxID=1861711 RepID=A0A2H6LKL8_9NOSO|nr:hypothetical protein [Nostoc cycadae]GBE93743.1 YtkA family protein [Nostoc cycadae WK-1]
MNRFVAVLVKSTIGIAVLTTLLIAQGCSPRVKSQEAAADKEKPTTAQPMGSMDHQEHETSKSEHQKGGIDHSEHSGNKVTTQVKLTTPKDIKPNTTVPLVINVQDKDGKAIANFDTFQEKLMHLIVVSDDLQFFNHIHPIYKNNGRFEVQANFPQPGSYTLFSDYKPTGNTEQISVLKTQLPGKSPSTPPIDLKLNKTFGDIKANLTFSQPTLKVGEEVTLSFDLKQTSNNQPVQNLQPYLGELGHLVILKQSSPLTRADYIHAHALKNTPSGKVNFMTNFPTPGTYKMWGQFNRNGRILVVDFGVNVQ